MNNYDVAVIGAGVIGTSVAYHLTKAGLKTVLIEQGDTASGTSSHCDSVALICDKEPGIDTQMGYSSIERFLELQNELSYDIDFEQRGCLYVCEAEEEMVAAKRYVTAQVNDGYDMRMLDHQEILDCEPYLAKDLLGGFWSDPDCTLNPYKLCYAFVQKGMEMGMDVMYIYGSHLKKKDDVTLNVTTVCFGDTFAALIAGMAIIPACVAMGLNPESGSGLIFVVLPNLLSQIPGGQIIGILVFLGIFFAAITTAVAQFEVPVATFFNGFGLSRKKTAVVGTVITLIGALA